MCVLGVEGSEKKCPPLRIISGTALKAQRSMDSLHPSQGDYCDTCKDLQTQIQAHTQKTSRNLQNTNQKEAWRAQVLKDSYVLLRKKHKDQAKPGYALYQDCVRKCRLDFAAFSEPPEDTTFRYIIIIC